MFSTNLFSDIHTFRCDQTAYKSSIVHYTKLFSLKKKKKNLHNRHYHVNLLLTINNFFLASCSLNVNIGTKNNIKKKKSVIDQETFELNYISSLSNVERNFCSYVFLANQLRLKHASIGTGTLTLNFLIILFFYSVH